MFYAPRRSNRRRTPKAMCINARSNLCKKSLFYLEGTLFGRLTNDLLPFSYPSKTKSWRRGVVVITTAQIHSKKPELRFCTGSNPTGGLSEIRDDEDLCQWSRLEIRLYIVRWSIMRQKNPSSSPSPPSSDVMISGMLGRLTFTSKLLLIAKLNLPFLYEQIVLTI